MPVATSAHKGTRAALMKKSSLASFVRLKSRVNSRTKTANVAPPAVPQMFTMNCERSAAYWPAITLHPGERIEGIPVRANADEEEQSTRSLGTRKHGAGRDYEIAQKGNHALDFSEGQSSI